MASNLPQYMVRRQDRRAGGISQLASNYKMQSASLADQYQTEFSKYQQMVAEKMAPYQQQLAEYKASAEPAYQTALADYNQKIADYQAQLAELAANPVTERAERGVVGRTWYGKKKYGTIYFYDPKPMPEFTAVAPDAPNVPVAPTVDAFDSTALEAKGKQLQSDFSREVGERKAARVGAVQRRSRTLLGGVKD